jgi:hypothetical protein
MSTAGRTLRFNDASSLELRRSGPGFRARSYNPGSRVVSSKEAKDVIKGPAKKKARRASRSEDKVFPGVPSDVLEKILLYMVDERASLSVVKLSMVSRVFRSEINANIKIWYKMYLHWRGPIVQRPRPTIQGLRGGVVSLRPTIPYTVPNFKDKRPSLS